MEEFAIDELQQLDMKIGKEFDLEDPVALYICSLFSEMAYCLVPQHEIDNKKRAKVIPSNAYKSIIRANQASHIGMIQTRIDDPNAFVVFDRGVLAVGIKYGNRLFVALRGTSFLYEWFINVKIKKIDVIINSYKSSSPIHYSYYGGKRHSGFAQESNRIGYKIRSKLDDYDLNSVSQIIFTGHSLGGAVAALVEPNFRNIDGIDTRLCVFGTPRFTDLAGCARCYSEPYTHVRRKKDKIPTTPPRKLGYADHPKEFGTDGSEYQDIKNSKNKISGKRAWDGFLLTTRKHHKMDKYRNELALTVGSRYVNTRLCDYPEIRKRDTKINENEE